MTGKIYSTVRPDLPKIVLMRRYGIATLIKFLFLEDKVVRIEFYVADCVETEARMRHYFCFLCFVVVVWSFFLKDTLCRLHRVTM